MAGDGDRSEESRQILERISREASAENSVLARSYRRSRDHFAAEDADRDDPVEVWGTRIGRVLGLAVVAGLLLWLLGVLAGGQPA